MLFVVGAVRKWFGMNQAVNWNAALEYVGGDKDLLRELFQVFIEECPRWRSDLHQAVGAGDAEKLQRSAHKLQGALVNFGADSAAGAAMALERLGKSRMLAGAETLLEKLELELDRLLPELRDFIGTSKA
jgi:two-component system, sensor histidine kinase and response regulator